jgi:hypothetical protein
MQENVKKTLLYYELTDIDTIKNNVKKCENML